MSFPAAETDLHLTVFPRSANTYCHNIVKVAFSDLDFCTHIHTTASLKLALKYSVPTIVLVRDPVSTCCSMLLKRHFVPAAQKVESLLRLLRDYGRGTSWLLGYFLYSGFRFSLWFRMHQVAHAARVSRAFRAFLTFFVLRQSLKTGIQINPGARIGPGLYMPHFGGIVVNPNAVIGRDCYLSHNVLIGKVHAGRRAGVPVVGDNVFIGAGAVILGNITIGSNASIGVNSVVINDVPPNVFVAGSPARVVDMRGADSLLGAKC